MRVLVVGDWDAGGGVLTVIRDLANHLRTEGVTYSVFFFNQISDKSPWNEFCEAVYYNRSLSLTELLTQQSFDVVHMIDTACPPPYDASLWLRRAGFQGAIVCNSHVCTPVLPRDIYAHKFIACSEASREVAAGLTGQEVQVIENGVDTSVFFPRDVDKPSKPVLAWVGRSSDISGKDIFGFLYLVARLQESEYSFWIASSGPLPAITQVTSWFGKRIKLSYDLGREQIASFYSQVAASGGVLIATSPPVLESFHLASLEAVACGCPIILPRETWSSHIKDGQTGLLYNRHDGLNGIVDCLAKLQDSVLREKLVRNAQRNISEHFNSARMAQEYHSAYLEAITSARSVRGQVRKQSLRGLMWSHALRLQRMLRQARWLGHRSPSLR